MVLDDTQVQQVETVEEILQQPTEVAPVEAEKPQVSQQASQRELNMRKAWEKAERAERERDELMRRLQQIETQKSAAPEDDDLQIGQDDIVEGKHLKQINKQVKELKQLIRQNYQQTAEQTAEVRLKAMYPDFDQVVSRSNIEMLREVEPELAATLNSSNDIYSKAVSAYKLIKNLGIHKDDIYAEDRERVQRNAAKPKPVASVTPQQGSSALGNANMFANGLTKELQSQLWKEMQDYAAQR